MSITDETTRVASTVETAFKKIHKNGNYYRITCGSFNFDGLILNPDPCY
jgi:hypothetical protein